MKEKGGGRKAEGGSRNSEEAPRDAPSDFRIPNSEFVQSPAPSP
jgi:hypothetical protein